jgi:15-cis-phytoene synthase
MSGLDAIVRAASRERYVATLFAPENKRAALFALYAFDAEIDRIRDLVHDPLPGEIRLQWWRDVANGERGGEARGHPTASALLEAISSHDLPRAAFDAYCEARIFDFYHDVMPDQTALEAYLGATQSAVIQLAGMVLDKDLAHQASETAGHAGVALGLVKILRQLPLIRWRGQGFVPQSILAAAGLTQEAFLTGGDAMAGKRVAGAVAALAQSHLIKFQALEPALPKLLRPAFLPLASARRWLKGLENQADPFNHSSFVSPLAVTWDVAWAALRGPRQGARAPV